LKFLLTNDDGIDAPGLAALERIAQQLGETVTVAPDGPISGCSHSVTTHRALELSSQHSNRHALSGTPADCTRVGLMHLEGEIDWVLSGVNLGGNLGADVYHSGTIAAAREAALLGKPAIALSQYRASREPVDWQRTASWAEAVIRQVLDLPTRPGEFWNINFPHVSDEMPPVVFCPLDPYPMPIEFAVEDGRLRYAASYQQRLRRPGHDVDHCFSGQIAVTQLSLR